MRTGKKETDREIMFSEEETELFAGIKDSLTASKHMITREDIPFWSKVLQLADSHKVVPLMYSVYCEEEGVPVGIQKQITNASVSCVKQQYRITFLAKFLIGLLEKNDVLVVLLKGSGIARYYPVPEYRKSGDIDLLLLEPEKLEQVKMLMFENGLKLCEEQHALHHICFDTAEGISLEVHTSIAEPFDNDGMNRYMAQMTASLKEEIVQSECYGVQIPVLSKAYNGYALLLHMLQHYLRAGFGLKLLCDWVVFWGEDTDLQTQSIYLKLVQESGVKGFSDMITGCCVHYLGLNEQMVCWMKVDCSLDCETFMREILDAGEFGREDKNRMVVMRNNHLGGYIREFHHQMRLRYPKESKFFVLWPFLWFRTFWIFMRNNRKLRGVSTVNVLRKAAKRSKIAEEMKLFKPIK